MTDKTTKPQKKRLFEDISLVQVVATALAAVTSMLLASYIGIAGSVIGVAVASVVSTTAASLYKHFLRESAEKIKDIPVVGKTHHLLEHAGAKIGIGDGEEERSEHSGETVQEIEDTKQRERSHARAHGDEGAHGDDNAQGRGEGVHIDADGTIPIDELAVQSNVVTIPVEEIEEANEPDNEEIESEAGIHAMDDGDAASKRSEIADEDDTIEDIERSKRRMKIGLIIVCVVSALVAVALSAIVIYVSSDGEGIGTKPEMIFVHTQSEDDAEDASEKSDASYSRSTNATTTDAPSSSDSSISNAGNASSDMSSSSASAEGESSSASSDGSHTGDDGGESSSDASSSDGVSEGSE